MSNELRPDPNYEYIMIDDSRRRRRLRNNFNTYTVYQKFISGKWVNHREDGYAVIRKKEKYYYLNGIVLTEEQWRVRTSKLGKVLYG
jgi:hypothetical protein